MGSPASALKDCPSCRGRIDETAAKCPLCRSVLDLCPKCEQWILAGRRCPTCKPPSSAGTVSPAESPDVPKILLQADPLPLLPFLAIRLFFVLAFLAVVGIAIAASELGPATRFVRTYIPKPRLPWPVHCGAAAACLVLVGFMGSIIRRFRMRHTALYGDFLDVRVGVGSFLINLLTTLFFAPLTAGIALPWLYARYRQSFYHNCRIPARGGKPLDFQGRGEGVLGRFALSLLLLPLGLASGGLLFGLIAWIWVKWEQSNICIPDRTGQYRPAEFFGSFWGYLGRWMGWWLLTLLTLGICRPWVKVAEWKWITAHTHVA